MKQQPYFIPAAIVVAGLLIAGAVMWMNRNPNPTNTTKTGQNDTETSTDIKLPPVTSADHIIGNPDANIVLVEYSDTECQFCKNFHATLNSLMNTYGKDGRLAWVYRHFPIPQLHPKAPREAQAVECSFKLGGNDVFWKYLNEIYKITPSNNGLDPAQLPKVAGNLGLDVTAFNKCLEAGADTQLIQTQSSDAVAAGAHGTPFSVLVMKTAIGSETVSFLEQTNKQLLAQMPAGSPSPIVISADRTKVAVSGAFPEQLLTQIIDQILSGK